LEIRAVLTTLFAALSICLLASAAQAGDRGDPSQSCDGNTFEMVERLKARTAQWDKRMTVAYQQALKDVVPPQREQLRAAQRLWIGYRDAKCLYYGLAEASRRPRPGTPPGRSSICSSRASPSAQAGLTARKGELFCSEFARLQAGRGKFIACS
jgi:uncharacterized protein YecT (DUF1311 family)